MKCPSVMPDGRMRKERKSPGETGSWPYGASSGTGLRIEKQPQAKTKTQRRRGRERKEMPGPSAKPQGELKPGATKPNTNQTGVPRLWKHNRIKSARRRTPNLLSRLETWNLTVRSAMLSLLAISLLARFRRRDSRTSCSRRLRLATLSVRMRRGGGFGGGNPKNARTGKGDPKPPPPPHARAPGQSLPPASQENKTLN